MSTSRGPQRHLPNSPFKPKPEPIIEQYAVGELVAHDSYGMGRVIGLEAGGVTVDFRTQTLRIPSPFSKMAKL